MPSASPPSHSIGVLHTPTPQPLRSYTHLHPIAIGFGVLQPPPCHSIGVLNPLPPHSHWVWGPAHPHPTSIAILHPPPPHIYRVRHAAPIGFLAAQHPPPHSHWVWAPKPTSHTYRIMGGVLSATPPTPTAHPIAFGAGVPPHLQHPLIIQLTEHRPADLIGFQRRPIEDRQPEFGLDGFLNPDGWGGNGGGKWGGEWGGGWLRAPQYGEWDTAPLSQPWDPFLSVSLWPLSPHPHPHIDPKSTLPARPPPHPPHTPTYPTAPR